MVPRNLKHSDEDVRVWAGIFVELGITLTELEEELEISHSTTWWCFVHRLPEIDMGLYNSVMDLLSQHRRNHRRRNSV